MTVLVESSYPTGEVFFESVTLKQKRLRLQALDAKGQESAGTTCFNVTLFGVENPFSINAIEQYRYHNPDCGAQGHGCNRAGFICAFGKHM
jgi:hypothetical protein